MAIVTRENVENACERIAARGEKVTGEKVKAELGLMFPEESGGKPIGSPNVIHKFMNEWKDARRSQSDRRQNDEKEEPIVEPKPDHISIDQLPEFANGMNRLSGIVIDLINQTIESERSESAKKIDVIKESALRDVAAANAAAEAQIANLKEITRIEIDEARAGELEAGQAIETLQTGVDTLNEQITNKDTQIEKLNNDVSQLNVANANERGRADDAENIVKNQAEELRLSCELIAKNDERHRSDLEIIAAKQQSIDTLTPMLATRDSELLELRKRVESLVGDIHTNERTIQSMKSKNDELQLLCDTKVKEVEDQNNRISYLSDELKSARQSVEDSEHHISDVSEKLRAAGDEIGRLEERNDNNIQIIASKDQMIEMIRPMLDKKDVELSEIRDENKKVLADLGELQTKHMALLAERAEPVVQNGQPVVKRARAAN